jgi:hypothetical protein
MWEAELDKIGKDVRGHFDAQLAALELVLDAATRLLPITEVLLREIHANACANQTTYPVLTTIGRQEQPLPHGEYKTLPNSVTLADESTHEYAPVLDTPAEMHRLVGELASDPFQTAHPVLQAAYAHHALTSIHPFADGNGRVARALASVFTYRAVGVPLVIFSDQQVRYWDALTDADSGRFLPFVNFIEERALDSMGLIADRLREAERPIEVQVARIREMFRSHGGLTHGEVQAVGERFMQMVGQALTQAKGRLPLGPDVDVLVGSQAGPSDCTFWGLPYHLLKHTMLWTLRFSSTDPVNVSVETPIVHGLANTTDNPFTFIAIDTRRQSTPPLRLRITDLHPTASAFAETRLEGWVDNIVKVTMAEFGEALRQVLRHEQFTAE